jgi:hypothetical protein
MNKCYRFEKNIYNNGLFDKSVDATYIIHLENNGRLPNINEQLNNYHPTKIVYILFNKGYKKCNKDFKIKSSAIDLVDAFLFIFKDAKIKNYKNILILEDDFFFNKNIKNLKILEEINVFLNKNINKKFIYFLGCIPYLQIPYYNNTNKLILEMGCHSCIYTKSLREYVLQQDQKQIIDWDVYHNFNTVKYIYYKPLCYQLFPDTENSKIWEKYFLNSGIILKNIFKFLKLDIQSEPGYMHFYNFSKIIFYIIVFFIILILIFIIMKINKVIFSKKSKIKK